MVSLTNNFITQNPVTRWMTTTVVGLGVYNAIDTVSHYFSGKGIMKNGADVAADKVFNLGTDVLSTIWETGLRKIGDGIGSLASYDWKHLPSQKDLGQFADYSLRTIWQTPKTITKNGGLLNPYDQKDTFKEIFNNYLLPAYQNGVEKPILSLAEKGVIQSFQENITLPVRDVFKTHIQPPLGQAYNTHSTLVHTTAVITTIALMSTIAHKTGLFSHIKNSKLFKTKALSKTPVVVSLEPASEKPSPKTSEQKTAEAKSA